VKIRFSFCALLLLALAVSAWSQAGQSPDDRSRTSPSQQAAPQKTISPQEKDELFKSVDEILEFASRDTKLPIKETVKRRLVDRNELESYLQTTMKEDKDVQRLARSEIVLKKFGLLPRDLQLQTFLLSLLKEQVAAYYDPKTKTVNLLNWVEPDAQRPVLAHELTHSLQDQSVGIEKWMRVGAEKSNHSQDSTPEDIVNDELQSARQAVVEGQAMVTLLDYTLAPAGKTLLDAPQMANALKQVFTEGSADTPIFRSAPVYVKAMLTFPYRYGIDFTVALLSAGGKSLAFAGALNNPPRSTREIMEPETYLAHEQLAPIKLIDFDKDFKAYERFDIGAVGELDVSVLVEQYANPEEAEKMYPQWRGGYYFAGRPKANKSAPLAILYVSRWSSAASAAEFAAVYAKSLPKRYKQSAALDADGKTNVNAPPADSWRTLRGYHAWLTEEGPVVIEVRGDQVLISESLDKETSRRVAEDFWGSAGSQK
jgi:hypothetical protein